MSMGFRIGVLSQPGYRVHPGWRSAWSRLRSWPPQGVAPRLLAADLLDQTRLEQRAQQVHGALPRHAQRRPDLGRRHTALIAQELQQPLLPRAQHQLLRCVDAESLYAQPYILQCPAQPLRAVFKPAGEVVAL